MNKLFRITTDPNSLEFLLKGQLSFMKQYYDITVISSNKEHLRKIGIAEGVNYYSVDFTRKITPLKDLKALYQLYRFFIKEKPHIVHTHTPKAGLIGMLSAYLSKVPNRLHTVAGMPLMETVGLKRKLLNITEMITYKCAHRIYPNSKGLYDIILKYKFCYENKMKIIGKGSSNGINTSYFSPALYSNEHKKRIKDNLNIFLKDRVFCFIGRLVKDKGINELVQTFIIINNEFPYTKLLLVGPIERELDPLLHETEIEIHNHHSIIFVGPQEDVRPFLSVSDIFVFPSYREGFPNVVMQAGAMELPCIVTNINGCNEIIEDGVNGLIIPPKNKEQLKAKMQLLLEDDILRDQLKLNARSMITSRYEQKMVWDALLAEYKSLENENV